MSINFSEVSEYYSSTTEQASTAFVLKGQTNQHIIRLKINTNGWVLPFSVTSVTFNTSGTTTLSNVTAARVYYTNSDAFSTSTQFGSQISSPSGNMVFNGTQVLGSNGVHSFWLVYDISASATTSSQYVDGTCISFTTNESGNPTRSPSVTDPSGNRQILGSLSGTVTVGEGGDYPTLTGSSISTGLFSAINSLGLSGNLTANIISDITETGFTALNQWTESGGSGYTLTIQPADASLKTISGNGSAGVIKLNGADRVTFNGNYSGSGQYLKFQNTNTGSSATVFYLNNTSTNNNIKNCIIEGSSSGDGNIYLTSGNTNTLIEGCTIKNYSSKPNYGINFYGANNSSTVRNCTVYDFGSRGIFVQGEGITVENNEVYMTSAPTFGSTGIYLYTTAGTTISNIIRSNKIHDLYAASGNSIIGIAVTILSQETWVYNNTISLTPSVNTPVYGMELRYSGAYLNLYYNSVYIGGTATSGSDNSYGLYFYSQGAPTATVTGKNNSVHNARTNSGGTGTHYGIYFVLNTNTTLTLNYNDYFVSGTGGVFGRWPSSNITDLATWKSTTSQDNNSISADPKYVSTSNLKPFTASPLISAGTVISGINTDIENNVRSGTNPYIGAYESTQTPAVVDFANLQTGNTTIKEGQTATFLARVGEAGVTNTTGQGSGIQCWIGYSTSNTNPSGWTNWISASYSGDADGGNKDEYSATIPSTLTPGTYYIASRFFITNAAEYQYGGYSTDGGGNWNGTTNVNAVLTIQNNTISFANVTTSPVSVKLGVNKTFYAKYELTDVTTQSSSCSAVQAWIGYNTLNTDPSGWTNWVSATFDGQSGNAHTYKASFGSSFSVDTYYYASRFKLNDDSYVYGGYSSGGGGIWNGTTYVNGVISVNADLPITENFDGVTAPTFPNGWSKTTNSPAWTISTVDKYSSPNSALIQSYSNVTADAWLFSPPLNLTGGTTYRVAFYAWYTSLFSAGKLKGRFGTSATAGGMTSANVFDLNLTTTKTRYSYTFTPSSSGTYYFGWHNYSVYYSGYPGPLCVDNIEISQAPASSDAQTLAANTTGVTYTFGSTGVSFKYDVANTNTMYLNVDLINSNPGINGSLPSGVNSIPSKYWNIQMLSGAFSSGSLTIGIDISGISGINKPQELVLLKRSTPNDEWQSLGTPSAVVDNICYWSGITSFSEFTLGGGNDNPLPVELSTFSANYKGREVILNWRTETEVNNDGFVIERASSFNGTGNGRTVQGDEWKTIHFVKGYGNSNSPKEYSFTDKTPPAGKVYYRLKQIDTDGSFTYSKEIEVNIAAPREYNLSQNYPNPFNPSTIIEFQVPVQSRVRIELFNITGELVYTLTDKEYEPGYYEIELNAGKLRLASGVYLYRMQSIDYITMKKLVLTK